MTLYLAYNGTGRKTLELHADDDAVNLLVALPFLDDFQKHRDNFNLNRWCLDSGAFSAHNSGAVITYEQWAEAAKGCDADEVFGLDVIGDSKGTRRNLERAWADGIDAIPTFHFGEPWAALDWCKESGRKIALGGCARIHHSRRLAWAQQCFARAWPVRVHGFACSSNEAVSLLPFDSVDATSWCYAPGAMGAWAGYTGKQIQVKCRGVSDYWVEVREHQRRERKATARWRRTMKQLNK